MMVQEALPNKQYACRMGYLDAQLSAISFLFDLLLT
jgi:hypothetical protein